MSEHTQTVAVTLSLPRKTVIEGGIEYPGPMVITGTVVGDVTCTSLVITERGIVHGSIRADDATILGEVNGEIYATTLTLKTASSVTGDIYHKQLTLEDGCYFEGRSRRHNTPLLLAS